MTQSSQKTNCGLIKFSKHGTTVNAIKWIHNHKPASVTFLILTTLLCITSITALTMHLLGYISNNNLLSNTMDINGISFLTTSLFFTLAAIASFALFAWYLIKKEPIIQIPAKIKELIDNTNAVNRDIQETSISSFSAPINLYESGGNNVPIAKDILLQKTLQPKIFEIESMHNHLNFNAEFDASLKCIKNILTISKEIYSSIDKGGYYLKDLTVFDTIKDAISNLHSSVNSINNIPSEKTDNSTKQEILQKALNKMHDSTNLIVDIVGRKFIIPENITYNEDIYCFGSTLDETFTPSFLAQSNKICEHGEEFKTHFSKAKSIFSEINNTKPSEALSEATCIATYELSRER